MAERDREQRIAWHQAQLAEELERARELHRRWLAHQQLKWALRPWPLKLWHWLTRTTFEDFCGR